MLTAAIVNDIKIARFLKQFGGKYDYNIKIDEFSNEEELYEKIKNDCSYDLLFIKERGENIVRYVREEIHNEDVSIVLISLVNKINYSWVKLGLFDCIVAPYNYETLNDCMLRYVQSFHAIPDVFRYRRNGNVSKISTDKVICIESNGRKVVLNTTEGVVDFYGRIADCMAELCFSKFIRCHKSYLVNPKHISAFTESHKVILSDGKVIPVSRSCFAENKERLLTKVVIFAENSL